MYKIKNIRPNIVTAYRIFCDLSSIKKRNILTLSAMPRRSKEIRNSFHTDPKNISVHNVSLEVIGTGADGGPANVAIVTNCGTYLINCGEGTSRLCSEYRIKVHRSPHVFITHFSWKNISGLLGMALSVQEGKGTDIYIYGDSDIGKLFSSAIKFVSLRHVRVSLRTCLPNQEFSDGVISSKSIFLYPSSSQRRSSRETSPQLNVSDVPGRIKDSKMEIHQGKGKLKCINHAISYIFKTAPTKGTLDYEKCVEFGVPFGPLLGELKNGKDVTLSNGNRVKSEDVRGPDKPGVCIIAVECPSEDFLDHLLLEEAFAELQSSETPADAVVHFSKPDVVRNKKYQEWLSRFPRSTLHLFINNENKLFGSVAVHRQQYKLNLLHPELFPLLQDTGIPQYPRKEITAPEGHVGVNIVQPSPSGVSLYRDDKFFKCESNSFIHGETLCELRLKPKPNFDYIRSMVLKKELFLCEIYENEEDCQIDQALKEVRDLDENGKWDGNIYPKILFLGTGSSKPSKVRNSSGILIHLSSDKCILLDCGENTYGQLILFYGKEKSREVLRNLQAIYVSHMHLDHHLGVFTMLNERKLAFDEWNRSSPPESTKEFTPLVLLSPIQNFKWLTMLSDLFGGVADLFVLVPNTSLLVDVPKTPKDVPTSMFQSLGLESVKTVFVSHYQNAFGISITHKDGWKLTYSGDTTPCRRLIELGRDSDILIHEATLDDAYEQEAKIKQHTTTSQAIDVGAKMNAKFIILTHFSQRYCYLPNIKPSLLNCKIGIAFDFMEVPFNKIPILPSLLKPLVCLFSKYDDRVKEQTEIFLQRKERVARDTIDISKIPDLELTPAKRLKVTK